MTTTATNTNSTTTSTASNHVQQLPTPSVRHSWACTTCNISFGSGQAQREHMKDPWHVNNLKRRINSLPAISLDLYQQGSLGTSKPACEASYQFKRRQVRRPRSIHRVAPTEGDEDGDAEDVNATTENGDHSGHCLFCSERFANEGDNLEDIIEHMSVQHGFFIPDLDMLSDLESFLGYLNNAIRQWHECLYCGLTRDSRQAIQSHMRDSSHCKLNLEREPELREFWEDKSSGGGQALVMLASSGRPHGESLPPPAKKELGTRRVARRTHRAPRPAEVQLVIRAQSEPSTPLGALPRQSNRQLARRDEMGIQSLGPQQRRALMVAEKKSQKEEEVASRAREWSYASKANKQKHDQAHGPLACFKGGKHNLLPR